MKKLKKSAKRKKSDLTRFELQDEDGRIFIVYAASEEDANTQFAYTMKALIDNALGAIRILQAHGVDIEATSH